VRFGIDIHCDADMVTAIEQAEYAEQLGYDFLTVAEHHDAIGYLPQPLMVLCAVGARTSRIRLGTNIIILPLYHPVAIAEQVAVAQFVSGGRIICGVGLGYLPAEFDSFGVPFSSRASRMEESLGLLRTLWSETDVEHAGKHFQFRHASVQPRLKELPTIWVGGWAEAAIRRAARYGDAWAPGPTVDFDVLRKCRQIFLDERAALGKPAGTEFPCARELYCAPTHAEAVERGKAIYQFYKDTYLQWPHPYLGEAERQMSYEELARNRFIVGDPDECAQAVGELRDMGVDQLAFRMEPPGVSKDDARASMELFMRQVVPQFR
jgi:alkanesulfonate monooxygenase SsuD/methylene tetrahydromethanopterin reductase-like flavin-dependent oxidoreductase (luciferase family)